MRDSKGKRPNRLFAAAAFVLVAMFTATGAFAQQFNQWGWPQPYERISDKSIAWMKERGWWPMTVAYQPPWSGQNAIFAVMNQQKFLQARGIEANFQAFPSGPTLNEVFISGRAQVGNGGNFPMNTLIDRNVPMRVIALMSPNLRHQIIVPNDSPLKTIADLRGGNPATKEPWVIGIATGSSAEFYLQLSLASNKLVIGKDVTFRNMPPPEQALLPRGIDAIVPWDFTNSLVINERKTGRPIDVHYPYVIYLGVTYVRQELVDNVPDVVQALTDAIAESQLWIRLNPERTVDALLQDPNLKLVPRTLLAQQVAEYNNQFKPTYLYPHTSFWFRENDRTVNWLYETKRMKTPLLEKEFQAVFRPDFMERTFNRLGWRVPAQPPFIPAGWTGTVGKPPYPEYLTFLNMKGPQPFPEAGDLVRPWSFNGQMFKP
ncbi:MAG: NrtA/SsuA/CpmA family ABC transporter substrate-binding protein [Burkholderiales bacterium]|nr:NrtA/SsuA/CpmA family ABC transporter substrate-binding protein [Burkholderiales bacterium]